MSPVPPRPRKRKKANIVMVMLLLAIQIIDCEKVDPHNTLSTHARDADAVGHRKLYCLLCSNLQGNLLLRRVLTRTIFCSRTYKVSLIISGNVPGNHWRNSKPQGTPDPYVQLSAREVAAFQTICISVSPSEQIIQHFRSY
ncbi:hypothetical protein EV424DRAFT_1345386 [Suillus variegatus]|nr:hypothetical protein EV424DRAFT_1345386 [Suillus variegatus]